MFKAHDVLLFQGDSITDCSRNREKTMVNDPVALGYGYAMMSSAYLRAHYEKEDLQILNRGISGNRVIDLEARWEEDCLKIKPDVLSILIGVNDTWHGKGGGVGVPVDQYEKVYRGLLKRTRKELKKVRLILCEPFVLVCGEVTEDWLEEMDQRRAIVKAFAEEFDAVFVPFQKAFTKAAKKAPMEYWAHDGVHPTMAGHRMMSETWLKAVIG